jgi:hypothetical protein
MAPASAHGLDPADSIRTSGEEFPRDDGIVFGRTAMSRRLIFRYIFIFPVFFTVICLVLPRLSPPTSDLGEGEYSSLPRLWLISFTAFKGASSSPSLRIAALAARDGYPNTIFRFNRPAKGDSSTYAGYRPHTYVSVILFAFVFDLILRIPLVSHVCVPFRFFPLMHTCLPDSCVALPRPSPAPPPRHRRRRAQLNDGYGSLLWCHRASLSSLMHWMLPLMTLAYI